MRATRTYAILEVAPDVYEDIKKRLLAADYGHALHSDDGREVIDMQGIALMPKPKADEST